MIQVSAFVLVIFTVVSVNALPFTPTQTQFQQQALDTHNTLRAKDCAPALELDDNLNQIAQQYAQYLADTGQFKHSGNGYGENLYMVYGSDPLNNFNGDEPVQSWYDEIKDYDFDNPGYSDQTGHFTQVVWKGSQRLGVGVGFADDGRKAIVVANYDPPGNYLDQFAENVSPPDC